MRKGKAFLINSFSQGGAERVVINLINELQDLELDILLLENDFFFPINSKFSTHVFSNKTKSNFQKILELPILALKLKKYCKIHEIILVQSHLPRANYVNILSKMLGAKHKVQIVSHGIPTLYKEKGALGKINLFLIKKLYNFADIHITVSKGLAKDFRQLRNFKDYFITIYNPFPISKIAEQSLLEVDDFEFNRDNFYFVFCGRLNPIKRLDQLISWFSDISLQEKKITFLIIGEGAEERKLKQLIQKKKIQNVHLIGSRNNPFSYIAKADCLLLNSKFEGFGNVIVESLICKTPVISADCDYGPREILQLENKKMSFDGLKHNDYSILFEQNNKKSFLSAINSMINNYTIFKKGADNWPRMFSREFSSDHICSKYKMILTKED